MGLTHRLLLFLVALLLTLFTWLGGGIVATWLSPWAVWLSLLIVEVLLVFPEPRRMETLFEARRRVWRGLLRDPLMWFGAGLVLFLTIQWLNGQTFLEWDVKGRVWKVVSPALECLRSPETEAYLQLPGPRGGGAGYVVVPGGYPWGWLPGCLRSDIARGVLDWFLPVVVALLAVRHGLLKRSKRWLGLYVCVMAAVLAVAGVVQYAVGGDFLYWGRPAKAFFFATFGYPNHAACFFPGVMALAIGMLLWTVEHREHTRVPAWVYGVVAALCGVAGVLSGSRAGVLFTLGITTLTGLYVPLRYFGSWPGALRVAIPALLLLSFGVVLGTAGFRIYAVKQNRAAAAALTAAKTPAEQAVAAQMPVYGAIPALDGVLEEIADTPWEAFLRHPMLVRSGYQGILALRQAADYPWYGAGAWSFMWLNYRYIRRDVPEEQEWLTLRKGVGQANVHNDSLQFLAEHGWVGFGLMLGCVAALLLPFLWLLVRSPAYTVSDEQSERMWVNRINVYLVFALVGTTMIGLHSFIDLVFRSPACMMLYGLLFVCAPGFVLGMPSAAAPARAGLPQKRSEESHA